jgi:hypothetical protein
MPPLTTPDGVLSGSGWMQNLPTGSRVVCGNAPVTLDSSTRYVLSLGGDTNQTDTCIMYLPAANSTPAGFDLTIKLVSSDFFNVGVYPAGADTIEGAYSYQVYTPLGFVTLISDGSANWYITNQGTDAVLTINGGVGVFGVTPPTTQPNLCVTLADVIAVLVGCGLCAIS